ncbi:MAG TPA: zf-HC2 domain-containing protein [Gemmatimonadaceae bacterium]
MTMTCEHIDSVLSAWFEGDLDAAERRAVDAHLHECLRCASVVRDLEVIRRDAAKLPAMAPSRDLWEGIAARIEAPIIELKTRQAPAAPRRNWQMAAAAVVLMAVSSGVTYVLTGDGRREAGGVQTASTPDSAAPGVVTPKRPTSGGSRVLIGEFSAPEIIYDQEITRLRAILDQRRGDLDSATVKTVEKSLQAIDKAIIDARAALTGDASNAFLNEQLNRALEKKLGVLRRVALLPVGAS